LVRKLLIIDLDYIIDMIEDKLVLMVSWKIIKSRFNYYNLSAIFMNNSGGLDESDDNKYL